MELVDEQDEVRVGLGLLDDGFQAFLEITPVLGAGHHRGDVQRDDPLLGEDGRDVPGGDPQGDPFHDGGLAHARFADEHRVVLLAASEDLDDAGDFRVTSHDRVQFPFPGGLGEVVAELFHVHAAFLGGAGLFVFVFGIGLGGLPVLSGNPEHSFALHVGEHLAVVHAAGAEVGLPVAVRRPAQGEQQVVRGRLRALEPGGLHHGDAQDVLRLAGEVDMVDLGVGNRLVGEDPAVDEGLQFRGLDAEPPERLEGAVLLMPDDSEEQVVRADAVASGPHRLLAGIFDDAVQLV